MGIRIEINSDDCSMLEWRALVAFASLMTGGQLLPPEEKPPIGSTCANQFKYFGESKGSSGPIPVPPQTLPKTIVPEDDPAAGIDTDAALQSAGFGGNAVGNAAVPAATVVPPAPPAMPPVPPVPGTAPVPAPMASLGAAQLDSKGLPWDHRIHSGERTQNKDGSWRNKRGLPDGLVAQVETELRAVLGVAAPPHPLVSGPAPGFPGGGVPAPPVPDAPAAPMTFMTLLTKVTKSIKDGQLAQDRVNATLVEFSLPNLPAIHHRPDLVQGFHDRLFGAA